MAPWEKYSAPSKGGPWAKYGGGVTQLQGKVADLPSKRPTLADEAMSFGRGVIEGIPIAGPALSDARRGLDANIMAMLHGGEAGQYQDEFKAADEELRGKTGGARTAGNVTGAVATLAPLGATALGGKLLGQSGSVLGRALMGGASGSAISGADTLARGGDLGDAGQSAVAGLLLGSTLPLAAKGAGMMFDGVKNALGKSAGATDDLASQELKSAATGMFKASDEAGLTISDNAYMRFLGGLKGDLSKLRINETLDPKASAVLEELTKVADERALAGQGIGLGDMHILRQIAQKAAQSPEGRDQMLGSTIVDKLDDFLDDLAPADVNAVAGDPVAMLKEGIATWHTAKKTELIEEAIGKAQRASSGFENGLRVQFRRILDSKRLRQGFSGDELAEMEKLVQGTPGANLMKLVGKFGFGGGAAGNMLGGTIGTVGATSMGGPVAGLLAGAGAAGARKASEGMTAKVAQQLLEGVSGIKPDKKQMNIARMLAQINDTPVNLPISPALAAQLQGR